MSEIAEAVQIVGMSGSALVAGIKGFAKLTELGVELVKAIKLHTEERMRERLSGEVSLEQLTRYEGNKLSTARFDETSMDELKPMLDSYGIPYVTMPDSEINGKKYTSITFGDTYKNRMAAVIQSLGGKGTIVNENTVPSYITSGEVSLALLQEQDGPQLMVYQFPDDVVENLLQVFNRAGLKYAVLPDLCLGDGKAEIAFAPSQRELIQRTMERIVNSKPITMEEYRQNADQKVIKEQAMKYDQIHTDIEEREAGGAVHMMLDGEDYKERDGKIFITMPELPCDFEAPEGSIFKKNEEKVTLSILPGDKLEGISRTPEEELTENAEMTGEELLNLIRDVLKQRRRDIEKGRDKTAENLRNAVKDVMSRMPESEKTEGPVL